MDEDPGELSLREVHIYSIYNYTHLNGQNARPNIDYLKDIFERSLIEHVCHGHKM